MSATSQQHATAEDLLAHLEAGEAEISDQLPSLSDAELTQGSTTQRARRIRDLTRPADLRRSWELHSRAAQVQRAILENPACPAELYCDAVARYLASAGSWHVSEVALAAARSGRLPEQQARRILAVEPHINTLGQPRYREGAQHARGAIACCVAGLENSERVDIVCELASLTGGSFHCLYQQGRVLGNLLISYTRSRLDASTRTLLLAAITESGALSNRYGAGLVQIKDRITNSNWMTLTTPQRAVFVFQRSEGVRKWKALRSEIEQIETSRERVLGRG